MLEYDFEQSLGYWTALTSHAYRRTLDAELNRQNITIRQWEVLALLSLNGEQNQVQLADQLCIEPPTLAGVIKRMERDGWLERTCCQEDRRKNNIRPTPKAEALWQQMVDCCRKIRAQATAGMTEEEINQYISLCQRVIKNMNANVGFSLRNCSSSQSVPKASDPKMQELES
ncbi:Transcriptional regulator SlyA [Polystyrenella longa]|uniref:Transcriptional regulator SlyA n=1 Tax=Polystyrenella longa TaxID=2528007 RepID=A0A518CNL2_9PLAN|nr:MarR family transcriptional regulator [Polystyrenella longa]QDU80821.1 Transcriptional regulator SlyA [Polystyrenella longa]